MISTFPGSAELPSSAPWSIPVVVSPDSPTRAAALVEVSTSLAGGCRLAADWRVPMRGDEQVGMSAVPVEVKLKVLQRRMMLAWKWNRRNQTAPSCSWLDRRWMGAEPILVKQRPVGGQWCDQHQRYLTSRVAVRC